MITTDDFARILPIVFIPLLVACSESSNLDSNIGYVEADWVYISSSQAGWIIERPVSEGDQISINDVLFELDKENQIAAIAEAEGLIAQASANVLDLSSGARPAELRALEARLAESRARLVQAEAERERILPLVETGAESSNRGEQVQANYEISIAAVNAVQEEIEVAMLAGRSGVRDAANAAVATAEAARTAAEVQLQERTITARVAGKLEHTFHQPGEFITAGTPVLSILPDDGLKIKFFVSQAELPIFSIGKIVRAKPDGLADAIEATVSFIATEAEFTPPVIYSNNAREKLVFLIEATLPANSGLRPGLPVDVDWS